MFDVNYVPDLYLILKIYLINYTYKKCKRDKKTKELKSRVLKEK